MLVLQKRSSQPCFTVLLTIWWIENGRARPFFCPLNFSMLGLNQVWNTLVSGDVLLSEILNEYKEFKMSLLGLFVKIMIMLTREGGIDHVESLGMQTIRQRRYYILIVSMFKRIYLVWHLIIYAMMLPRLPRYMIIILEVMEIWIYTYWSVPKNFANVVLHIKDVDFGMTCPMKWKNLWTDRLRNIACHAFCDYS